jgi:HEAT repeat protein
MRVIESSEDFLAQSDAFIALTKISDDRIVEPLRRLLHDDAFRFPAARALRPYRSKLSGRDLETFNSVAWIDSGAP